MSLDKIVDCIKNNKTFLLTAHHGPEGDSIGSQLGMYHLLKRMGKEVYVYNHDPVPGNLFFLPEADVIEGQNPHKEFDVGIVLDCSDMHRIGKVEEAFKKVKTIINIDHHISNVEFGDLNYVDGDASSASELVYRVYKKFYDSVDYESAIALYTGMYTDTGSFKYSCTSPEVHEVVADLLRQSVEPHEVSRYVRSSLSVDDIRFVGKVMSEVKCDQSSRFLWACINEWKDDSEGDLTDTILHNLQLIKGAEVFVLFKLVRPNIVRINLRSQGNVDVNEVAKSFNGGGHAKAAGATVEGMGLKQVEEQVVTRIKEHLEEYA